MITQVLTAAFLTAFLAAGIRVAVPILIAALGEMVTQRSGIINLGIEGIFIIGSFTGFTVAYFTKSLFLGFLLGGIAGGLFGLLMGIVSVRFLANQIVTGLGFWIMCGGLAKLLVRTILGIDKYSASSDFNIPRLESLSISYLSKIPVLGEVLFNQNIVVYLTLLSIPLFVYFFKYTRMGLNIDATGENPRAADAAGINVGQVRMLSVTFGGILAGLAGAYLPLALYGVYTDDMAVGLGWMAIVVVPFGKWRPWGILAGSMIFGAANALQFRLQNMNFPLPYQFLLMFPYFVTLIMVILFSRGRSSPSALTKPYFRSEH
ncbi:MAG: ABC transporter permease [Anaerolineae bacterium]|nr:ABC transporter permease [Anaerolineae bacterium]